MENTQIIELLEKRITELVSVVEEQKLLNSVQKDTFQKSLSALTQGKVSTTPKATPKAKPKAKAKVSAELKLRIEAEADRKNEVINKDVYDGTFKLKGKYVLLHKHNGYYACFFWGNSGKLVPSTLHSADKNGKVVMRKK